MTTTERIRQWLGADSPLAKTLPGFRAREPQQRMAAMVAEALQCRGTLLAEAGTGTGKTFAYLLPALLSGAKTLISTGTKTLQDQIFTKDLPRMVQALQNRARVALLKGRNNYLCLYRMELSRREGRFPHKDMVRRLEAVYHWSKTTADGDLSRYSGIGENDPLLPWITSTRDNCTGSDCDHYDQCLFYRARQKALEADLIVVNHHLLFADLALRQSGYAELLPACDLVVVDEAHQAPDVAGVFFSRHLTSRQLLDLAGDTRLAASEISAALAALSPACTELEDRSRDFLLALPETRERAAWSPPAEGSELARAGLALQGALKRLQQDIQELDAGSRALDGCRQRAGEAFDLLETLRHPVDHAMVCWFERGSRYFQLHLTPLDIGEPFRQASNTLNASWVFTSATLSVAGDFHHFSRQLGITGATTLSVESPFDYWHNSLLYHPPSLPDPRHERYTETLLEACMPALEAACGQAFLLFTSHRALQRAAAWLKQNSTFKLLVQGESSRPELLERFRQGGHLLLGAASFWEGVDVPGDTLRLVLIDKLPFQPPDDPVLEARIEQRRKEGGNPFVELQLPQAVLALKQGAGRLIRTETDYGVLVLCDPRLRSKPYGRLFLDSLPRMPRSTRMDDVIRFFRLKAGQTGENHETART